MLTEIPRFQNNNSKRPMILGLKIYVTPRSNCLCEEVCSRNTGYPWTDDANISIVGQRAAAAFFRVGVGIRRGVDPKWFRGMRHRQSRRTTINLNEGIPLFLQNVQGNWKRNHDEWVLGGFCLNLSFGRRIILSLTITCMLTYCHPIVDSWFVHIATLEYLVQHIILVLKIHK